ncbi:putative alpha-xyloside ABC transporter, permease component [Candidatus Rhodobacter oscarellae]|uniref:Putative alpha-xyloside ABC transporter, permease component n=1 Tax=Candidatus Rhodobacter oscarellae TaxID=1675527 RepID=A0A0J9GU57_9RHOB|nr:sugar ABC transporter permease [Candidatus Rhodobacter lobularis]KMW57103.1 putative alpha-xyloside ABC transporter, permease component [Candidatus Rhodobacter lobularis]
MLATAILFLLVFAGIPLIYTVILSFQEIDPFKINRIVHEWVGFENYRDTLGSAKAWSVFSNTVIFLCLSVSIQFVVGFGLALVFVSRFVGRDVMRGLFLVSWITPQIAVGIIWVSIFSQKIGILNYALTSLGIVDAPIGWLTDPDYALYSVTIANIWLGIPFNMIFLTVGLLAIPSNLYEAARMDGANAWSRFRHVTLPSMIPTIVTVISLGIIFTLQQFELFAAMTSGGPAGASLVMQYWSWEFSFLTFEIGKGSTIATAMLLFVTVVGGFYVYFSRVDDVV